jgi:hypothetical protein
MIIAGVFQVSGTALLIHSSMNHHNSANSVTKHVTGDVFDQAQTTVNAMILNVENVVTTL